MARLFLDTSALIKLYLSEPNSPAVQACVSPDDELLIAQITPLEFHSALYGLVRQGLHTEPVAAGYIAAFDQDLSLYAMIPATDAVFQRARTLLAHWAIPLGLRPLDAIQLASAIEADTEQSLDALLTTDNVLAQVARATDLKVQPE